MESTRPGGNELRSRPALPEDETLLHALFAEDKAAQFAGMAEALARSLIEMQYRGQGMSYAALYPQAVNWILLDEDGKPIGRLLLDVQPDCMRIVDIAILAACRNQGRGTQALRQCQQQAAEAGSDLRLRVMRFNPAFRLYERMGFRAVSEDEVAVEMLWSTTNY